MKCIMNNNDTINYFVICQVLIDSSNDQYTYRQAQEMSPTILSGIITFLDTMDSPEFLPTCIDILIFFSESYQSLFGQRFKVT